MSCLRLGHEHVRWNSRTIYWILGCLIAALLFVPPERLLPATSIFILGIWLLAAAACLFLNRRLEWDRSATGWGLGLLALLLSLAVSAAQSGNPAAGFNALTGEVAGWLVFLLAALCARQTRTIRRVYAGWVVVAAVLSLYALQQHVWGLLDAHNHLFGSRSPQGILETELAQRLLSRRAFAFFTYPNLLAGCLSLLAPVGLLFILRASQRASRWGWGLLTACLGLGLYASGSVGGWLAAGVGCIAVLLMHSFSGRSGQKGRYIPRRVVGIGLGVIVGGVGVLLLQRDPGAWLAEWNPRWENWLAALRMVGDHPFWGVGPGQFGAEYSAYQSQSGYYVRYAHNVLLHRWAETGTVGLLVWVGFITLVVRRIVLAWKAKLSPQGRALTLGIGAGLVAVLLHAMVDVDFEFFQTRLLFQFGLGTVWGLTGRQARQWIPAAKPRQADGWGWAARVIRWGVPLVLIGLLWKAGRSLPVQAGVMIGMAALVLVFYIGLSGAGGAWIRVWRGLPLRLMWVLLFTWGMISAMVSQHPFAAIPAGCMALAAVLVFALVVLTPESEKVLLPALALSAAGLGAATVILAMLHPGERIATGWPNPNLLAAFLSMGLMANMAGWLDVREPVLRQGRCGLSLLLIVPALLATGSLGGSLNAIVGLSVLGLWTLRQRSAQPKRWWVIALGLVVATLVLPLSMRTRLAQLPQYGPSLYERVHIAQAAWRMLGDHPWFGYGPGNFAPAFELHKFRDQRGLSYYGKQAEFAHNEWLQVAATTGFPGGMLLLTVVFMVGYFGFRQWHHLHPRDPAPPARGVAWAILAGGMAQALVDFNWHPPALLIWYLACLGAALKPEACPLGMPTRPRVQKGKLTLTQGVRTLWRMPVILLALFTVVLACLTAVRPIAGEHLFRLGEAHYYKKNMEAAAAWLERSLALYPFSAPAYDRLGMVQSNIYGMVGSENARIMAEWAFRKALRFDRLNPYIHRHLAHLAMFQASRLTLDEERDDEFERAVQEYHHAISKAPWNAPLWFELGNLLRDMNQLPSATQAWQEAVALEPRYAAAWSNLGVVYDLLGQWDDAESCFQRALAIKPISRQAQSQYDIELLTLNWAIVHYNLAYLLERQGRLNESNHEYRNVLELEPENPLAQERLRNLEKGR